MTESITCPTCCETFEIQLPPENEIPCDVDYDCEICCRPMIVHFSSDGTYAEGLAD